MTSITQAEAATAADDEGMLPPYSGADAICAKCALNGAFTKIRPAVLRPTVVEDWNGQDVRRGPLPERLERECERCGYRWDEALVVTHPGMTVDALVYALDNSTPYRRELERPVLEYMAFKLLGALHIVARPDNPLWKYSDGRPPAPVAPQDPADTQEAPR